MNLGQLRTEVQARGFSHISPTSRLDDWINRAYHRICEREAWAFLETTTTGTAPLTISDLRNVLSVSDQTADTGGLPYMDVRILRASDPSLNDTGSAICWYMDGQTLLKVWPANTTNTFSVRYLKVETDLGTVAGDSDTPIIPARFHQVIVDGALREAYKNSDNVELSTFAKQEFEEGIASMAGLLVPNYDSTLQGIFVSDNTSTDW